VRRSDVSVGGWGENLFIDVEYDNINISIIDEKQLLSKQKIPRVIYQTFETLECTDDMFNSIESWKNQNPDYEHYFFDNDKRIEFIQKYFDKKVVDAYLKLIPGAFKADLWRYCVLYKNGGVYLDIKYFTVNDFKLIELTDREYFVKDIEPSGSGVYNAFMICKPGNKKLLNCINNIVKNVKNKFYGEGALAPTGPLLLKKEFTKDEIDKLRLSIGENECPTKTCINLDGNPILAMYKDYYKSRKENKPNYHEAWKNRKIYT
jgi:mannosyltransferase OCH1-like enzyme